MIRYTRVPDYIRSKYISWKGDSQYGRVGWLDRAKSAEEYYYSDVEGTGTTFTQSQYQNIVKHTNLPISANLLHPVVNQKLAILSQSKGSFKVISSDGRAKQEAWLLDKMKHSILYSSSTQLEIEAMIKDMLIAGMGHLMIIPTDFYQPGSFNLSVINMPYDEVILDINAKRRTLEDMEGFFIEKAFTLAKFMRIYGDIASNLMDEEGNKVAITSFTNQVWIEGELTERQDITTANWNLDNKVVVREFYEKVFTTMYLVPDPSTDSITFQFAENLDPLEQTILSTAKDTIQDVFIKKSIIFGDFLVWEEVLPITEYPLKTAFFEWGGRPYRSYGTAHFIKGMGQAFDKILGIMILNGILANSAGWLAPKGSIVEEDRAKWEDAGADPTTIKEYIIKVIDGKPFIPTRDTPTKLSNFYPAILDLLKTNIEYSIGLPAVLQGRSEDANVEVFSSLQQYQNSAMMRILLSTFHINESLRQIGQTLIEYMIANLKPDSYQFLDDKGQVNEVQLAQNMVNSIKSYRYNILAIPATSIPTQRLATATELMKVAQSSPDPTERQVLVHKAMELSDIREFDEITEKLDTVRNMQGKYQQLEEAYNRLMETSKQMENKYINVTLENKILKEVSSREKQVGEAFAAMETKLQMADKLVEGQIKGKQDTTDNN